MRIVLLFGLVGCVSSEPVREGRARIAPEGASYRVVAGSNDTACAHGSHFVPTHDADVLFGPSGGAMVPLAETTAGTYTASAPAVYAAAYQFTVDGELFELPAPPDFTATVTPMSTGVKVELSNASAPSDVVIHMPDGRTTARTIVASSAVIDADCTARGDYEIDLIRTVESELGVVEIQRRATLTVP